MMRRPDFDEWAERLMEQIIDADLKDSGGWRINRSDMKHRIKLRLIDAHAEGHHEGREAERSMNDGDYI